MIKDNQQHFNRLQVVMDAVVVIVSYAFAWWLKFSSGFVDKEIGVLSFEFYMRALILIVPLYILLYYAFNCSEYDNARKNPAIRINNPTVLDKTILENSNLRPCTRWI